MTSAEFRNQYLKLARGFGKDTDVTDERLRALFDRLGHYSETAMRHAVDDCLAAFQSMPSFDKLHAALDRAADRERLRASRSWDDAAKRTMEGDSVRIHSPQITVDDLGGLRAFRAACTRAWDNGQTPEQTAFVVAELARTWPFLWEEVVALWAQGNQWRNARGEPDGPIVHDLTEAPEVPSGWRGRFEATAKPWEMAGLRGLA